MTDLPTNDAGDPQQQLIGHDVIALDDRPGNGMVNAAVLWPAPGSAGELPGCPQHVTVANNRHSGSQGQGWYEKTSTRSRRLHCYPLLVVALIRVVAVSVQFRLFPVFHCATG